MSFKVVAYYTEDTLYARHSKRLERSLKRYEIPYYIQPIKSLGSWFLNTAYKPIFIREMMKKFEGECDFVVYVDVDAKFLGYPKNFDSISCEIAAYIYDGREYRRNNWIPELLSGTLCFKICPACYDLVEAWAERCRLKPKVWDQKNLAHILSICHTDPPKVGYPIDFQVLPGEYCKIFDKMDYIREPIIVHFQASRDVRATKSLNHNGKVKKKILTRRSG